MVINLFHTLWVVIYAFLLLNLVTGAIINNYQAVMDKTEHDEAEKQEHEAQEKEKKSWQAAVSGNFANFGA